MSDRAVDVRAVVAEIEAEVARRRAAGEYDEALLRRLSAPFHVESREEPLEALAQIITHRIRVTQRPPLDRAVVFAKRVLRRTIAWYVQPVAIQQTAFNVAVTRDVRALERRVARLETRWMEVAVDDGLDPARAEALAGMLGAAAGRVLVLGPPRPPLVTALRQGGADASGEDPEASPDGVTLLGDPVDQLEAVGTRSLDGVVVPGLLPLLSATDLLELLPLALARLRPGGVLWLDAPDPAADGMPHRAGDLDPRLLRWVPADTAVLLAERAGFAEVERRRLGDRWYAVTARRPA